VTKVAIVSACRTPIGAFNGGLKGFSAPQLGSHVISAAIQRAHLKPADIESVIMGHVLTAGTGQAPARQAALGAGLPNTVACLGVNKVCGSGLQSVILGAQAIATRSAECVVAGGMESMSNAPYLLPKARTGYRLGHGQVIDSMIHDGLWDVYNDFHMGSAAEMCAKKYHFSRSKQDDFAKVSYERALTAQKEGFFSDELIPVDTVLEDEDPRKGDFSKMPKLKPVFHVNGTVTAANASSLNDGAAAVVLMEYHDAKKQGLPILATLEATATVAHAPEWFTTAPIACIQKLLHAANLTQQDIDLFEINEAFSVVNLAVEKELGISREKINIHGGAVALGHPIGASGTRILVTLLHALKRTQKKIGLATLCIGGGEAIGVIVRRC